MDSTHNPSQNGVDNEDRLPVNTLSTAMLFSALRGLHSSSSALYNPSGPDAVHSSAMDLAIAAAVPAGLAPALIPLYKLIHGMILKKHQYNITPTTTKLVLAVGAALGIRWLWGYVKPLAIDQLTTSITIPNHHRLAGQVREWMAAHAGGSAGRHVLLSADAKSATPSFLPSFIEMGKKSNVDIRSSTRSTAATSGWFWLGTHPIRFEYIKKERHVHGQHRLQHEADDDIGNSGGNSQGPGSSIHISCLRFWPGVLKKFEAKVIDYANRDTGCTNVWRLNTALENDDSYTAQLSRAHMPFQVVRKPSRPLSTVDLDAKVKQELVGDVAQFLHPGREKWYATRGIPYRRGILLHGEPGTGKSSTAIALAGEFKSDLYIINLNDCTQSLEHLFSFPKRGDIILLEDIDSAGINRENMKEEAPRPTAGKKITLSALLNAIDSITGTNGVILLMTTNNPESLDKALIRPGRIDMQVHFGLVKHAVAESIFVRMYQDDDVDGIDDGAPKEKNAERINRLAKTFAAKVPDCKLTPAEIQGFLTRNQNPDLAIEKTEEWAAKLLEAKEAARNIIGDEASKPAEKTDSSKDLPPGSGSPDNLGESNDSPSQTQGPETTIKGRIRNK